MVMLMFIAHPNIVQYMLYEFKCQDVDGVQRLKYDLEIQCWTPLHNIFTFVVALPALIVWGFGMPVLAFWLLSKKQSEIMKDNPHGQTR